MIFISSLLPLIPFKMLSSCHHIHLFCEVTDTGFPILAKVIEVPGSRVEEAEEAWG
jgi:hypothetical protein